MNCNKASKMYPTHPQTLWFVNVGDPTSLTVLVNTKLFNSYNRTGHEILFHPAWPACNQPLTAPYLTHPHQKSYEEKGHYSIIIHCNIWHDQECFRASKNLHWYLDTPQTVVTSMGHVVYPLVCGCDLLSDCSIMLQWDLSWLEPHLPKLPFWQG